MKNKILAILICAVAVGLTFALGLPLNIIKLVLHSTATILSTADRLLGKLQRRIYRGSIGPLMNLAERLMK